MWWKRRRLDEDDFQAELRAHLDMAARERVADGADPRDASDASLKEFGNVLLTTEAARRVWTPWWVDAAGDLAGDVRHAIRSLLTHRGFALAVIGVLAVGIGLNAAVFTMLKGLALSPLAGVDHSARLALIHAATPAGRAMRVSYADYLALRDGTRAFTSLGGSALATVGIGGRTGAAARSVWGEFVTGNYFEALGVRAQVGRTLQPSDEDGPGRQPVVVLGDGFWRRDFGADPAIVGRTIEINDQALTVVGVADPRFRGTTVVYEVEVYVPITMAPSLGFSFGSRARTPAGVLSDRAAPMLYPMGFLREDVTREAAAAQVAGVWRERRREATLAEDTLEARVVPFLEMPGGAPSILLPTLGFLAVMGLLLLFIACANIAGLVLVRGMGRRGEIAVRMALGAPRVRIVRLLVVENLVLALPGAALGVLVASRGIPILVAYAEGLAAPQRLYFNIDVDALVIGFAVTVAAVCALVFGFIPALRSARVDLLSVINQDANPRGAARGRFRAGLVVAQVAVSLLLLVGAGLVARSLDAARQAPVGYDPTGVTAVELDARQNGYDEPRGRVFYERLLAAARADGRFELATLAAYEPLAFLDTPSRRVSIDGHTPRRGEELAFLYNAVGPDYFRTLRIPLRAGRAFDDRDDARGAPVAIVNETMATRFWGDAAHAVGQRLAVEGEPVRTIVGVAADVKYIRINEQPRPYFYLPFAQSYRAAALLHTRGAGPPHELVERTRAVVTATDPDLPILSASPLTERMRGALLLFNLMASMLLLFGLAGLTLVVLGTYGLIAYTVKQSTREIGIRMALGASARRMLREFTGRGLRLASTGIALGVIGAFGAGRLIAGVLYGVSASDPMSYAQAIVVVVGAVLAATLVPAWRASKTEPLSALRHQ